MEREREREVCFWKPTVSLPKPHTHTRARASTHARAHAHTHATNCHLSEINSLTQHTPRTSTYKHTDALNQAYISPALSTVQHPIRDNGPVGP